MRMTPSSRRAGIATPARDGACSPYIRLRRRCVHLDDRACTGASWCRCQRHARSVSALRQHARAVEFPYPVTERDALLEEPHDRGNESRRVLVVVELSEVRLEVPRGCAADRCRPPRSARERTAARGTRHSDRARTYAGGSTGASETGSVRPTTPAARSDRRCIRDRCCRLREPA